MLQLRKVKQSEKLGRAEFHEQFTRTFEDPRFDKVREAVAALEEVAWQHYLEDHPPPPHSRH